VWRSNGAGSWRRLRNSSNVVFHAVAWTPAVRVTTPSRSNSTACNSDRCTRRLGVELALDSIGHGPDIGASDESDEQGVVTGERTGDFCDSDLVDADAEQRRMAGRGLEDEQ